MRRAFKAFDIPQVDAGAVLDFLEGNWVDKLPTQRAMKASLSKFFAWAVVRRHVQVNPCRGVAVKKPKKRQAARGSGLDCTAAAAGSLILEIF